MIVKNKKIFSVFIALIIALSITGCSSNNEEVNQAFDKAYEAAVASDSAEFTTNLSVLNLNAKVNENKDCLLNSDYINRYVTEHSAVDFFDKMIVVYNYGTKNSLIHTDRANQIMSNFLSSYSKKIKVEDLKGTAGYYTENSSAEPQPSQTTVTGKFNAAGTMEPYTETKTNTTTCEYYGDYAKSTTTGYKYDAGRYEWVNGKFYDEAASWKSFSETTYYYKGNKIEKFPTIYQVEGVNYNISSNYGSIEKLN